MAKRSITILGAGPAGLIAAINLAGAGFSVRVYERQHDVGHLSAGDLEGLENWSSPLDVMEQLSRMGVVWIFFAGRSADSPFLTAFANGVLQGIVPCSIWSSAEVLRTAWIQASNARH